MNYVLQRAITIAMVLTWIVICLAVVGVVLFPAGLRG